MHSTGSPSSSITCPTASGKGFDRLLYAMLEAGMVTSEQILLVPEDVLSVIGVMGQARARILRNYAKRVVLPMLGLVGKYEEPEIAWDEAKIDVLADTGYANICKEFLELGDSDEDEDDEAEAEDEVEIIEGDELEDDDEETSDIW